MRRVHGTSYLHSGLGDEGFAVLGTLDEARQLLRGKSSGNLQHRALDDDNACQRSAKYEMPKDEQNND